MQQIANLQLLASIDISNSTLSDAGLALLNQLPSLRHISLTRNKNLSEDFLVSLSKITTLEFLSLNIQPMSIASQEALENLDKLVAINIMYVYTLDSNAMRSLLSIKSLDSLRLEGSSGVSKELLEGLSKLPKLSSLYLDLKQIELLPDLSNIRSLRYLRIFNNKQYSADKVVSLLTDLSQLESISILNLVFTEEQLETMVNSLPNLKSIEISSLQLPASKLSAFQKSTVSSIRCSSSVYTPDTTFDDSTLQSLIPIKSLKELVLSLSSPVTEAGLAAFKKARPDVSVTRE